MLGNLLLTSLLAILPAQDKPAPLPTLDPERAKAMTVIFEELQKVEMEKLLPAMQKAKSDDEAKKIALEILGPYPAKLIKLGQDKPADPVAFECFMGAIGISNQIDDSKTTDQAVDLLFNHHKGSERLGIFCQLLAGGAMADPEKLLERIEKESTNAAVKGQAAMALASFYTAIAENAGVPADKRKEAFAKADSAFARVLKDYAKEKDPYGNSLGETAAALSCVIVGKVAPDAKAKDLDGKPVSLADHKGKVVVLDIWATWYGPCKAMIPHERKMVEKFKDKPFVLISVSGDYKPETVKEFLKKEPMPWVHWFGGTEPDSILGKWCVHFFPSMIYVIDSKGVIRYKHLREGDLEKAVAELEKAVAELLAEVKN
jgi:thiol-disulfide isomerase/thioredoxin